MVSIEKKVEAKLRYLVNAALNTGQSNKPGVAIDFTLRFGQDRFTYKIANITIVDVEIGIQEAYINWNLQYCKLPDLDWAFDPQIQYETNVTSEVCSENGVSNLQSSAKEKSLKIGVKATATENPIGEINGSSLRQARKTNSTTKTETVKSSFEHDLYTVTARGSSAYPSWQITAPPGQKILKGAIFKNHRFARAEIEGPTPAITVELELPQHGLVFIGENGTLSKSPNKWGITRQLLKKKLLAKQKPLAVIDLSDCVQD